MNHKITIRLSDEEYGKIKKFAKNYYKNNVSKTIRIIIIRYMEIFSDIYINEEDLPFN